MSNNRGVLVKHEKHPCQYCDKPTAWHRPDETKLDMSEIYVCFDCLGKHLEQIPRAA